MRKSNTIHAVTCLIVSACLAAACGSSTPAGPSAPTVVRHVVVLGDSLSVTPTLAESFPAVIQARMADARVPWTVINAGAYGDRTADGLRRYESLLQDDVGVLVLELGANDGLDGVDVNTIERNLAAIIEAAQARGIAVVLCGMETPPLRGLAYALAFHEVFPRLARRYNVPLVPFLLTGVALVPAMNGPDGVHPNAAGARRVADNVWVYLEPLLRPGGPGGLATGQADLKGHSTSGGVEDPPLHLAVERGARTMDGRWKNSSSSVPTAENR